MLQDVSLLLFILLQSRCGEHCSVDILVNLTDIYEVQYNDFDKFHYCVPYIRLVELLFALIFCAI